VFASLLACRMGSDFGVSLSNERLEPTKPIAAAKFARVLAAWLAAHRLKPSSPQPRGYGRKITDSDIHHGRRTDHNRLDPLLGQQISNLLRRFK
jgi:hypothetical protein